MTHITTQKKAVAGTFEHGGLKYSVSGDWDSQSLIGTEILPAGTTRAAKVILIPADVFKESRRR